MHSVKLKGNKNNQSTINEGEAGGKQKQHTLGLQYLTAFWLLKHTAHEETHEGRESMHTRVPYITCNSSRGPHPSPAHLHQNPMKTQMADDGQRRNSTENGCQYRTDG